MDTRYQMTAIPNEASLVKNCSGGAMSAVSNAVVTRLLLTEDEWDILSKIEQAMSRDMSLI